MADVLSQSEVDALLDAVSGGSRRPILLKNDRNTWKNCQISLKKSLNGIQVLTFNIGIDSNGIPKDSHMLCRRFNTTYLPDDVLNSRAITRERGRELWDELQNSHDFLPLK